MAQSAAELREKEGTLSARIRELEAGGDSAVAAVAQEGAGLQALVEQQQREIEALKESLAIKEKEQTTLWMEKQALASDLTAEQGAKAAAVATLEQEIRRMQRY